MCCNFYREFKVPCRHILQMSVQIKKCTTLAAKKEFLKFWCDPIFLVSNYIKAYSSEQVIIPSLYDGPFKKDTTYGLEIERDLLPPLDKKIVKVGRRRKKDMHREEKWGDQQKTVRLPPYRRMVSGVCRPCR